MIQYTSITEFWRRWHISLSSFFKDYVYIPLGGSRKGNVYINLLIVFFLTGLWHGAAWNFVIWGLWHGCFRILEMINKKYQIIRIHIPSIIKRLVTMLIVMIGWVMFRADTMGYAFGYIGRMFGLNTTSTVYYKTGYYVNSYRIFIIIFAITASLGLFKWMYEKIEKCKNYLVIRNTITLALLLVCIIYVMTATYNPFIYFRF